MSVALCECGCGRPTTVNHRSEPSKGWVKGEPRRFIKGHHVMAGLAPEIERDPATGCWNANRTGPTGYGRLTTKHGRLLAHRVMYARFVGPIPDGMQLDHLCRNRRCCNPAHLEVVTNAENARRGARTRLTREQVEEIRAEVEQGTTRATLGRRFGITAQYVGQICNGKKWVAA